MSPDPVEGAGVAPLTLPLSPRGERTPETPYSLGVRGDSANSSHGTGRSGRNRAQFALLSGRRLHMQDGPIDLIAGAFGNDSAVLRAFRAACARFGGLLDELCLELPELRRQAGPSSSKLQGPIARRMFEAVRPFAAKHFITPMAAVAGSVAEEVLAAMTAASGHGLEKAILPSAS
jgi:hypothetical protein